MSKLDDRLKQLKEQERALELDKRKIEFLQHILQSAKDYNHKSFVDVKNDVVSMLSDLVDQAIQKIEGIVPTPTPTKGETPYAKEEQSPPPPVKKPEDRIGANDKLSFAMDNRHLAGKSVSVANDKNITIKGKVVGLDAPYVLVATESGPTIKVPLEHVSLN